MIKKIKKTLLVGGLSYSWLAINVVVATTPSLASSPARYEFICDQTNIIGHPNESGQVTDLLHLYKNGELCTENYSLKILSGDQENKIQIVNNNLVWDKLDRDNYFVTVAAVNSNGKKLAEKQFNLLIGNLILGPLHLNSSYDQSGESDRTYSLLDNFGKTIENKIDWNLEDFSRNGKTLKDFDKSLIKFTDNKIQWASSLDTGIYQFKIIGKQNGNVQNANVTLNINNNYQIQGNDTYIIDNASLGNHIHRYKLLENNKITSHKNYIWKIKSLDKNSDITGIKIDDNGVLSVNNFPNSEMAVAVIAQSTNDSTRELCKTILQLTTHRCIIRNKENSRNWKTYINKSGSEKLFFYLNDEEYRPRSGINWKLECDETVNIKIASNGRLSWTKYLVPGRYSFYITATDNNNKEITATVQYILDVVPYHFNNSSKKNFVCAAGQKGRIDFPIYLVNDENKVVNDNDIEFRAYIKYPSKKDKFVFDEENEERESEDQEKNKCIFSDLIVITCSKKTDKKNFCFAKGQPFHYTSEHHLEWDRPLRPGSYAVWLKARSYGREFASQIINIQAIETKIVGKTNVSIEQNNTKQYQYKLHFADKLLINEVNWSLTENYNSKLNIDQNGSLIWTDLDPDSHYATSVVALYNNKKYQMPIVVCTSNKSK